MISPHSFPEARNKTHHTTADSRRLPQCTQEPGWVWCGTSSSVTKDLAFFQSLKAKKSKNQRRHTRQTARQILGDSGLLPRSLYRFPNKQVSDSKECTDKHSQIHSQDTVTRCACPSKATGSCLDFTIISKSWSPISETRILAAASPEPMDLYAATQKLGDGSLCAEREEAL